MKVCAECGHERGNHSPGYDYQEGGWRTVCRVVGCGCVTWEPTVASSEYASKVDRVR